MEIKITKTACKKQKPDPASLGFGKYFTDHMFLMDYTKGKGWHDARIVPFGDISLSPAAMVFHYGQEMFEGLKAYAADDGSIQLFRPQKNIERMNRTNRRLCIPQVDPDFVLEALKALVSIDADWVPEGKDTSLYIRPFIIATDAHLGVKPATQYLFCIILSPVGAYYAEGLNPVKIFVETDYVRAVKGGIGFAKAGGNYAASLAAQEKANELGYSQVLWLDGVERKYIEEVGAMNVMFKIKGKIVTPALTGSVLPGITRRSCIQLLKDKGYEVEERLISVDEVMAALESGEMEEAWGCGTAAVISPIGSFAFLDKQLSVNGRKIGPCAQDLYDTLTGIQWGRRADPYGWIVQVPKP